MKIGIISDTHGSAAAWERLLNVLGECDMFIHAGDVLYHGPRNQLPEGYDPERLAGLLNNTRGPVLISRGNCDAEIDGVLIKFPIQAPYVLAYVNDKSVLVTHGQDLDEKGMIGLAEKFRANMIICGHTHVPLLEQDASCTYLNPGSCALPKSDVGATVALWEGNEISLIALSSGSVIKKILL
ncbi:phosphodiesterase [Phosphitispora sp. TUW77]|uniref:phosphodiesterase n=1 Tax=Phosphitispora sp. TUW77 TaxID=3152361 RepID=UPI003AB42DB1